MSKTMCLVACMMLTAISAGAGGQQIAVEQVDQALSIERLAGANAIAIKDQRIAALQAEIERLRKEAANCKPKEEPRKP